MASVCQCRRRSSAATGGPTMNWARLTAGATLRPPRARPHRRMYRRPAPRPRPRPGARAKPPGPKLALGPTRCRCALAAPYFGAPLPIWRPPARCASAWSRSSAGAAPSSMSGPLRWVRRCRPLAPPPTGRRRATGRTSGGSIRSGGSWICSAPSPRPWTGSPLPTRAAAAREGRCASRRIVPSLATASRAAGPRSPLWMRGWQT
mmetsp:Transcript_69978/g.200555  ORF Transcript_69978/g.200555 Transcript_69978/m.200555 type:complete len:205 (+) Transcript_69978:468-1082(+)